MAKEKLGRLVLTKAASFKIAGRPEKYFKGKPVEVADEKLRDRLLATGLFEIEKPKADEEAGASSGSAQAGQ